VLHLHLGDEERDRHNAELCALVQVLLLARLLRVLEREFELEIGNVLELGVAVIVRVPALIFALGAAVIVILVFVGHAAAPRRRATGTSPALRSVTKP